MPHRSHTSFCEFEIGEPSLSAQARRSLSACANGSDDSRVHTNPKAAWPDIKVCLSCGDAQAGWGDGGRRRRRLRTTRPLKLHSRPHDRLHSVPEGLSRARHLMSHGLHLVFLPSGAGTPRRVRRERESLFFPSSLSTSFRATLPNLRWPFEMPWSEPKTIKKTPKRESLDRKSVV